MESHDHLPVKESFGFQSGNIKFERVPPVDVTVKEENYQQSTRHWGMQIKPPTQGRMNGIDTSKNLNNIGFDLGLFCGLIIGLDIFRKKTGLFFFLGEGEGGVEACAKIKHYFGTFACS